MPCILPIKNTGTPEEAMILVTRLNQSPLIINSDLIEHIDVTPDTVIAMTTGQILRVRETASEVVKRVVEFRRSIQGPNLLQSPEIR
jgi:flagellar protein FlbD